MAKILKKYIEIREKINEKLATAEFEMEHLLPYQELLYRIAVLEACQTFCKTAPISVDTKALCYHYQIVDAYLCSLSSEHKVGAPADKEMKARRQTALDSYLEVLQHCRKFFGSFQPTTPELYKTRIIELINTVLTAWIEYRDSYVDLKKEV